MRRAGWAEREAGRREPRRVRVVAGDQLGRMRDVGHNLMRHRFNDSCDIRPFPRAAPGAAKGPRRRARTDTPCRPRNRAARCHPEHAAREYATNNAAAATTIAACGTAARRGVTNSTAPPPANDTSPENALPRMPAPRWPPSNGTWG